MRVLVLTLGTRGDLELFLALARELCSRGHEVVLASSGFYADAVSAAGVEFTAVGSGTRDELLTVLRGMSAISDRAERTRLYARQWLRPQFHAGRAQLGALGTSSDYFVSNIKVGLERNGALVQSASVTYDPPWRIDDLARYGPRDPGGAVLDLVALPRKLVDPAHEWGEQFRFTGFWWSDTDGAARGDLADFVAAGPPPVVLTLGSMAMADAAHVVPLVTAAARRARRRCVVVRGWTVSHIAEEPDVFVTSEALYDWLFPRACCVIHHGGTGTVAAALRSGVPSIVLPQITCQELFGCMLEREHLAAGVFGDNITLPELAATIDRAATDPAIAASVRIWQTAVRADGGVARAADLIEAHAARPRSE